MKTIAALSLVLVCAACAPSSNSGANSPNTGVAQQENRTALDLFYGDYTVVSQNGEPISGSTNALTCSTNATIANSVSSYPMSGGEGAYTMDVFTDASGAIVKSDDIWIAPGALLYENQPKCSDFHVYVFADRGKWRMGQDFVTYDYSGTLMRGTESVTFDTSLRVERLDEKQIQVQIDSKTSDGEFSGTWVLVRR